MLHPKRVQCGLLLGFRGLQDRAMLQRKDAAVWSMQLRGGLRLPNGSMLRRRSVPCRPMLRLGERLPRRAMLQREDTDLRTVSVLLERRMRAGPPLLRTVT